MLEKANITRTTKYIEVKSWFKRNMDQLPETLDGRHKYYASPAWTANMYICQIDNEIERLGPEIKKSTIAKAAKDNLVEMYNDLQWEGGWNLPMAKTEIEQRERREARNKWKDENREEV